MADEGAGILVCFPRGQKATASAADGGTAPSASHAGMQAASMVLASDHGCKKVVFHSEALSTLHAYQHKLSNLARTLQQSAATRRAVLQWIPVHNGISGNETADAIAKEGARGEQHEKRVSFSKKMTIIKVFTMPQTQMDNYHLLTQDQQFVQVRLHTAEHNRNSSINIAS